MSIKNKHIDYTEHDYRRNTVFEIVQRKVTVLEQSTTLVHLEHSSEGVPDRVVVEMSWAIHQLLW